MQNGVARTLVTIGLTSAIAFLSPLQAVADDRAHKERHRLLHQQYSLLEGPSYTTAASAGAALRAERLRLRMEHCPQAKQMCSVAQATYDSETWSARHLPSASTKQDGARRKKHRGSRTRKFFVTENIRKIRPSVVVTFIDPTPTEECASEPAVEAVPAPRFGSGPLRSIPRSRENIPPRTEPTASVAA